MTPKIKICGITESQGLEAAVQNKADFIGFVFHGSSPRCITPEIASHLIKQIPESIIPVGLLVDPDDALLDAILSQAHIKMIQLHGHESPERTAAIRIHTRLPVMKALRIGSKNDAMQAVLYNDSCDYFLFDAKSDNPAQLGGTGQRFDWSILEGQTVPKPWMLAGGLTPDNVTESVNRLSPWAVDVSSGVEVEPGIKDAAKIAAFIQAARQS